MSKGPGLRQEAAEALDERTPAGPDNGPPHRSWGAEGVPPVHAERSAYPNYTCRPGRTENKRSPSSECGSNLNQRDRATRHGEEVIDPNPPPHDGGSRPPLLRRIAQARARPDRHRGQWLSDGREPRPQARFRAVFHPLSSEANAKGARGFERSGYCQQRVPAVLVGYPKVSSAVTASSAEPGSYEGVTG